MSGYTSETNKSLLTILVCKLGIKMSISRIHLCCSVPFDEKNIKKDNAGASKIEHLFTEKNC